MMSCAILMIDTLQRTVTCPSGASEAISYMSSPIHVTVADSIMALITVLYDSEDEGVLP